MADDLSTHFLCFLCVRVHCVVLEEQPRDIACRLVGGVRGSVCVSSCYGGHSVEETPGSIPNPEAKLDCADGTALGRVWESRSPPDIFTDQGVRTRRRDYLVSPCSRPFFMPAHPLRECGLFVFPGSAERVTRTRAFPRIRRRVCAGGRSSGAMGMGLRCWETIPSEGMLLGRSLFGWQVMRVCAQRAVRQLRRRVACLTCRRWSSVRAVPVWAEPTHGL